MNKTCFRKSQIPDSFLDSSLVDMIFLSAAISSGCWLPLKGSDLPLIIKDCVAQVSWSSDFSNRVSVQF